MADPARKEGLLERSLGIFADVRGGEGATVLMLTFNAFLLLWSYYLVKTIREPLILVHGGAEVKSYASAAQAVVFLVVAKIFDLASRHLKRGPLVGAVLLFFASNLVVFYALSLGGFAISVPFYIWVGVFNLTAISSFWAFANDLYGVEQGERLFPMVGAGSAAGAVVGALTAKAVVRPLGVSSVMLLSIGVLVLTMIVTWFIQRRAQRPAEPVGKADDPLSTAGAFTLVFRDKYFLMIGALYILWNCANSNGEFILDRILMTHVATELGPQATDASKEAFIGEFKGDYFFWVNLLTLLLQFFLVSRIVRFAGIRRALFVMPLLALGGYSLLALAPVLAIARAVKIAENATDYSLNNTARHALFLIAPREAKYKAKLIVDTLCQRIGDVGSAAVVFVGTKVGLGIVGFVSTNIVVQLLWLAVVVGVTRMHKRRTAPTLAQTA